MCRTSSVAVFQVAPHLHLSVDDDGAICGVDELLEVVLLVDQDSPGHAAEENQVPILYLSFSECLLLKQEAVQMKLVSESKIPFEKKVSINIQRTNLSKTRTPLINQYPPHQSGSHINKVNLPNLKILKKKPSATHPSNNLNHRARVDENHELLYFL